MPTRPAWYFVDSASKLEDLFNLMHLPYTGMVLSFALIGALAAPTVFPDRVAATLAAYFLGLGIGAHSLDQLDPRGSHYSTYLSASELVILGAVGLTGAISIGAYYAATVAPYLILLIVAGVFFAVAYALPSFVGRGIFHNNLCFSFSWGYLPYLTSYYVNSQSVPLIALLGGLPIALAALAEIMLSRSVRRSRKEAEVADVYAGKELALKFLVGLAPAFAVTFALLRFA